MTGHQIRVLHRLCCCTFAEVVDRANRHDEAGARIYRVRQEREIGRCRPRRLRAAAGLLGLITGAVILRTHGLTQLMLTLAIAAVCLEIANKATDITGGADGLSGVVAAPILGLFKFDLYGKTAYLWCLAATSRQDIYTGQAQEKVSGLRTCLLQRLQQTQHRRNPHALAGHIVARAARCYLPRIHMRKALF